VRIMRIRYLELYENMEKIQDFLKREKFQFNLEPTTNMLIVYIHVVNQSECDQLYHFFQQFEKEVIQT
jgi:hypothetical protein